MDREDLLALYDFPSEHSVRLRSQEVESVFATCDTGRFGPRYRLSRQTATLMAFKRIDVASRICVGLKAQISCLRSSPVSDLPTASRLFRSSKTGPPDRLRDLELP